MHAHVCAHACGWICASLHVYACVCMCECMQMYVWVHAHVFGWQRTTSGVILYALYLVLRQGFSLAWSQGAPGIPLSLPVQCWYCKCTISYLDTFLISRTQAHVFTLVWQVLYWLTLLTSHKTRLVKSLKLTGFTRLLPLQAYISSKDCRETLPDKSRCLEEVQTSWATWKRHCPVFWGPVGSTVPFSFPDFMNCHLLWAGLLVR